MSIIIFDFNTINSKKQFYEVCKKQLQLPDYFGNNLDALWDALTGSIELPIKIVFNNVTPFHRKKFAKQIDIFKEAADELPGEFDFTLEEKHDEDAG